MVTREEKHSTRGRARLLFEMATGDVLRGGWREEAVKEALDLCLACKGCKGDCPVNVDVATYKAEFLAHYYAGRFRPRAAYAMGLIHWWARLASMVPALANGVTQGPLSGVFKAAAGIAPQRRMPAFAWRTFRRMQRRRGDPLATRSDGPEVLLWVDTFNDNFHPQVLLAAQEVLRAAGFRVRVPPRLLCCGRPLYDWGMLDRAKSLLRRTLAALGPDLRVGTPIVGLEPSCIAVFRDELVGLFPHDEDALRLSRQVMTLGEFLTAHAPGRLPRFVARVLLHGHCHQKAVMGMDGELAVLGAMGVEVERPDAGCCGMAGAFGFEKGKYEVSMAVGERVLLPAVRAAAEGTLIVADGFSCREQIAQGTPRQALHLAEVVQRAYASISRADTGPRSAPTSDI
jgi:Fe-S oxidoreductase